MRLLATAISALLITGCATQNSNERAAQHSADQIKMVAIQREARLQEKQAEAQMNVALVEALARVAEANPEHAPSVSVALAVIGVRGADTDSQDGPVVTLQREQNVGLEYVKALAPTVGTLVSGLGVAAINASVTKNAQDANRDIQTNSQNSQVAVVQAVAGLGTKALDTAGIQAGGDVYQVSDSASIDQSITQDNSVDSSTYVQDQGFINHGENIHDSTISYAQQEMSLGDLISFLSGLGSPYTLTLDGEVVAQSTEGEGDELVIDCSQPLFSPMPPQCT